MVFGAPLLIFISDGREPGQVEVVPDVVGHLDLSCQALQRDSVFETTHIVDSQDHLSPRRNTSRPLSAVGVFALSGRRKTHPLQASLFQTASRLSDLP